MLVLSLIHVFVFMFCTQIQQNKQLLDNNSEDAFCTLAEDDLDQYRSSPLVSACIYAAVVEHIMCHTSFNKAKLL